MYNFRTYFDDISLNEEQTARANAQTSILTVDENLVVNGNTTLDGNVGIGADSPNYALDVSGTINCNQILINGAAIEVSGTGSSSGADMDLAGNLTVDKNLVINGDTILDLSLIHI